MITAWVDAIPFSCGCYVEGEKDADNLITLGLLAVTAGSANDFRPEIVRHFEGREIAIFVDNDDTGRKSAGYIARLLHVKTKSIKIIELPGLPEKGDVSDWIQAGGTKQQLLQIIEAVPAWTAEETETCKTDKTTGEFSEYFMDKKGYLYRWKRDQRWVYPAKTCQFWGSHHRWDSRRWRDRDKNVLWNRREYGRKASATNTDGWKMLTNQEFCW